MTTDIKPATDGDIAAWAGDPVFPQGIAWSEAASLLARIDSDRAKIAALETTCQEFSSALQSIALFECIRTGDDDPTCETCPSCIAHNALQRAKQAAEQGKGEM